MVSCTSNAGIRNCNLNVFQALRAIELFDRHGTSLSSSYNDYENSFDKVWVEFLAQGSFHDGLSSMENKVSRMIGCNISSTIYVCAYLPRPSGLIGTVT